MAPDSAECALERPLVDTGLTLPDGDVPEGWRGYTHHGQFYERVSSRANGTVTLGLRPVPAEDVLADVAVPVDSVPDVSGGDAVRQAVETVSVRVDPPFAYEQRPVTTALSAVAGTLLAQRGRRHYGEWRAEATGDG